MAQSQTSSMTDTSRDDYALTSAEPEASHPSSRASSVTQAGSLSDAAAGSTAQALPEGQNDSNSQKKKLRKDLKIRELPPLAQIQKAIPPEGIDIKDLVRKFASRLDHTNMRLFIQVAQEVSVAEIKIWLKPSSVSPDLVRINELRKEAVTPPLHRPKLRSNQAIASELKEDATITFSEPDERGRAGGRLLPKCFFRVDYEQSATLSTFTSQHTHVKHRDVANLRLHDGNAFQAIGDFKAERDLTCYRIERHLKWNQKKEPSSYISAFGDIINAKRRCEFHYNRSEGQHIGERITVTAIGTADLVPATIRGRLRETIVTTESTRQESGSWSKKQWNHEITERSVQIPVWIHKKAVPEDQSPISFAQLAASGADMWLSITELRMSKLKVPASRGHDYEWLACGAIPKSRVSTVIPWDGNTLCFEQKAEPIRIKGSNGDWIWDWSQQMWLLEDAQCRKRKQASEEVNGSNDVSDRGQQKRARLDSSDEEDSSEHNDGRCTKCKQLLLSANASALFDSLRSILASEGTRLEVETAVASEVDKMFSDL